MNSLESTFLLPFTENKKQLVRWESSGLSGWMVASNPQIAPGVRLGTDRCKNQLGRRSR